MCVVSEEAAVTPLCDTLIMTCQTGDMATPNSLKCNTRVWCQSLTHHLCLSHMDTNTQNRGPMTVLNTHTNNITAYTYTLFRTELHYCILAPNLLKIVRVQKSHQRRRGCKRKRKHTDKLHTALPREQLGCRAVFRGRQFVVRCHINCHFLLCQ